MTKKPMVIYDPNAKRSKLPEPTLVMPYKNSSQIMIGDRQNKDLEKYQYKTMNGLFMLNHDRSDETTHGGIIAQKFRLAHKK